MMRVAYDHQIFESQRYGGISRYFVELVRNLAGQHAVEPTVIAPLYVNEYLESPDVQGRVCGRLFSGGFSGSSRVVRALNAMMLPFAWGQGRFDILHETYYSLVTRGRCRVRIVTVYDMIHELFSKEIPGAESVIAAKLAAVRRADHVICISETTRQDAIRLAGIDPNRSSVIYLGGSFGDRQRPLQPPHGGRPFVLYVGARAGYKNFAVLLQTFAASPLLSGDFDLVAFGGGPFTAEEHKAIQSTNLGTRVRQVQGDDDLLQQNYCAASVFVYPSRYEGFGIPPLEAMANGCPVVCSNAGSIAEVVGDGGDYFDPDNVDQLRAVLEAVLTRPNYAEVLRARGLSRVESYSWGKCAQETLALYRRLA